MTEEFGWLCAALILALPNPVPPFYPPGGKLSGNFRQQQATNRGMQWVERLSVQSQQGNFGQFRSRRGRIAQIRFANETLYQLSYTPTCFCLLAGFPGWQQGVKTR